MHNCPETNRKNTSFEMLFILHKNAYIDSTGCMQKLILKTRCG
jgi:hypothetical protein